MKRLFEKEFLKLGYKKFDMKLNLNEMRKNCESNQHYSENELMLTKISDIKTARKLGFLIVTDSVDGNESQIKSNEVMSLNISCKASPKNLRSKEKTKGKRPPKRHPKATEKELIKEKLSQGKKLSLGEIALLDPDQLMTNRADREYERSDEKSQNQTPQKYHGNPTYAILEVENKLKMRQSGSAFPSIVPNADVDIMPIKGYTKQMMEILKKQQLMVEQLLPSHQKRNRDGLRNVIKPSKKNIRKAGKNLSNLKSKTNSPKRKIRKVEEAVVNKKEVPKVSRQKRVPKRPKVLIEPLLLENCDDTKHNVEDNQKIPPVKRKRGRPKVIKNIVIESTDTEEVYYDIPGEGSNYDAKEMSEDENEPEILSRKRSRNTTPSGTESSQTKRHKGRYSDDDDYDFSTETDEATIMSSVSNASNNRRPRQTFDDGIVTRNKIKSRSTSCSAAVFAEGTDQSGSDLSESDYELQSGEDSGDDMQEIEFGESATDDDSISDVIDDYDSNDSSNDSIDFKYSPITKTRRTTVRNVKSLRGRKNLTMLKTFMNFVLIAGRRINVINARNFRLVSTQG